MGSLAARIASALALVGLLLLLPVAAMATPTFFALTSGSATVRGTLSGLSTSIFEGSSSLNVPLVGVTAVYDADGGLYGRLESLTLQAADFDIDLDQNLVGLDTLHVSGATLTSLTGSDLNLFGQFALPTSITGSATGAFPGGSTFGPVAVQSLGGTGSTSGLVSVSGDEITIAVVGVTVASFPQLTAAGLSAPNIEIKADFVFQGHAVVPTVPEPSAALLFAAGLATAGMAGRCGAQGLR